MPGYDAKSQYFTRCSLQVFTDVRTWGLYIKEYGGCILSGGVLASIYSISHDAFLPQA